MKNWSCLFDVFTLFLRQERRVVRELFLQSDEFPLDLRELEVFFRMAGGEIEKALVDFLEFREKSVKFRSQHWNLMTNERYSRSHRRVDLILDWRRVAKYWLCYFRGGNWVASIWCLFNNDENGRLKCFYLRDTWWRHCYDVNTEKGNKILH